MYSKETYRKYSNEVTYSMEYGFLVGSFLKINIIDVLLPFSYTWTIINNTNNRIEKFPLVIL